MIHQDLRSVKAYILSIIALVLALFIPFSILILRLFKPLVAAFILGIGVPLAGLILGVLGLIKNFKQSQPSKITKILSILSIIISIVLIIVILIIFIKAGNLVIA